MSSISPDAFAHLSTSLVLSEPALDNPDTAWSCHLPFAFWLMEALRPQVVVELGVHNGVSYCAFCQAAAQLGLSTTAYGVDTWQGDAHAGNYGDLVYDTLRAHHDPRYASFSSLVRATFDQARDHFPPGSIDLLHIDGLHTYQEVLHDFETWLPAMSASGVVLFHDIAVRERDFGVWRLWETLRLRYPSFSFPYGHGLGVLGVGKQLPEPLNWLLSKSGRNEADDAVVRFFAPLGERLEAKARLARALRENVAEREAHFSQLNTLRGQLDDNLAEREAHFSQLNTLRGQLDDNLAERESLFSQLNTLRGQLDTHAMSLAEQQAAVTYQQQIIATLQGQLTVIQASRSWRITAPLRQAKQYTKRLKQRWRAPSHNTHDTPPPSIAPQHQAFVLKPHYPLRDLWYERGRPDVSLVVLNFNKPDLTLACLDSLWSHTQAYRYEIVLVDNGSHVNTFIPLTVAASGAHIVRIGVNRYFGEGNNIGFEATRGRYVVFLNNDITVGPNWLGPLIQRLENDPSVGAVGPKMVYPNGVLQEAGAEIGLDGNSCQFGKGGNPADPAYNIERDVMYISAAAIAMRRATFEQVLGFDLCYEPAYYEDSDLCMKIRQLGLRVVYCPEASVVHHENATSRDLVQQLSLDTVVPLNKIRFLSRWLPVMTGQIDAVPGLIPPLAPAIVPNASLPSVLLYTPYELVPGGGERYLLTLAAGLAGVANVTLATLYPFSRIRLLTMGRELSLDLDAITITTLEQTTQSAHDWSVVIGNEVLPSIPARGKRNLYICQFPFPANHQLLVERWDYAEHYERIVVYSPFAQRHYRQACQALDKVIEPVTVVSPPAQLAVTVRPKKTMILGVGRFFTGGHAKRHDLMIKGFAQLFARHPDAELHLAGSLSANREFHAYFHELQHKAKDLPVFFHLNASPEQLNRLYSEASIYWHLAGYGVDEASEAYRCEHFGITVVEAMSAGCLPVVVNRGGPPEIVQSGVNGYVFENLNDLVRISDQILSRPAQDEKIAAMRAAAVETSQRYSNAHFIHTFRELMGLNVMEPDARVQP